MKPVAAVLFVFALGCGNDVMTGGPGGDDTQADAPPGTPVTNVSGTISTSGTWTGIVNVTGPVTIATGCTITVDAGTTIKVASASAGITIDGTFDIEGTKAMPVTIEPATSGGHWAGFGISANATLTAHYMNENGGGVHLIATTAQATIIDSTMARANGDLLTMQGGNVDVEYSWIGLEPPMADTTHCDMHFGGTVTIKVTHTNVSTSAYGIMFYAGVGADFTYDNWFSNSLDIDAGAGVQGDFSFSWFERAPTAHAGLTMNSMASARLTDAGPR